MKRNSKIILFFSILVLGIAISIVVFLFSSIEKNSTSSRETHLLIEDFNAQLKNLRIFERFLLDTEQDRKRIESAFINQSNQDEFLGFVKKLEEGGSNIGLDIDVVSTSLAQTAADKGPSLHLVASGNFSQVFNYSQLLENLPYEISFESINFERSDDGIWKGDYVIRLLGYEL